MNDLIKNILLISSVAMTGCGIRIENHSLEKIPNYDYQYVELHFGISPNDPSPKNIRIIKDFQ